MPALPSPPSRTSSHRVARSIVLTLIPDLPHSSGLTVLAIGAHSDDIEIGCRATILRLVEDVPNLHVCWIVLSAPGTRSEEARASARAFLGEASHERRLGGLRESYFPHDPGVKEYFEELKNVVSPDILFVHTRFDLHQDHRVACELAWNTFRDHLVLEYEVPKYDGDLGAPTLFVPVEDRDARRKAELLVDHFGSQREKHWFSEDRFLGLIRVGVETRAPTGLAEVFYARKLRLEL